MAIAQMQFDHISSEYHSFFTTSPASHKKMAGARLYYKGRRANYRPATFVTINCSHTRAPKPPLHSTMFTNKKYRKAFALRYLVEISGIEPLTS